jgi:membrane-bound lytic murein transglycosylase D
MRRNSTGRHAWLTTRERRGLVIGGALAVAGLTANIAQQPRSAAEQGASGLITASVRGSLSAGAVGVWDIANLDHARVDYWVERFTTGDRRDEFTKFYARKGRYEELISTKLAERSMPQDLLYLAMIESGFNPTAYSSAAASGLWQFIRETGERYGLDVNRAVDERRDFVKSTDAALDYLGDLYDRFGTWYLAAAAYNTGENRVGRIMREETGSERGTDEDYYRIWNRLPRETRDYVPLMIAAARISKEPARYGFAEVPQSEPLAYEEVAVQPATPLGVVASGAGTTIAAIKELNPQLKLDRTRNDQPSIVRVPVGP